MPLQATSGAASYDTFGGGVAVVPAYIEEVFQTWLYTGNSGAQTITNGIDLSTKGGLAWLKMRNFNQGHILFDTIRGVENYLQSASSDEQFNLANSLTAFNTTGFTVGVGASVSAEPYVSWSFEKQPKFFDMVSWTGSGSNRTIAHSLGSVPACIMVKRTDVAADWQVYHSSLANTEYLVLNSIAAKATGATRWNSTTPTSAVFSLGTSTTVNASGGTYVAYIFASNSGGFGLTGTDNVISCGTFSVPDQGPEATVTLGYEPQWIMVKRINGTSNWLMFDTMRGWEVGTASTDPDDEALWANLSDAANPDSGGGFPTATGFVYPPAGAGDATYIYIAIRKGPMKVPTDANTVFKPLTRSGTGAAASVTTVGFPPDVAMVNIRDTGGRAFVDKLRGPKQALIPSDTGAELTSPSTKDIKSFNQNGISFAGGSDQYSSNSNGFPYVNWYLRRAPNFFDVVCWTKSMTTDVVNHNLTVVPELIIAKCRSAAGTYWDIMPNVAPYSWQYNLYLPLTNSVDGPSVTYWGAAPTSTQFSKRATSGESNGATFVAYLFATCGGVSKVGSYTGNGSTQTINCGFTGGVRFVLIKRTDSASDWYAYDTARGMTTVTDPYIPLNNNGSNAEVATLGSVTTVSTGFAVDAAVLAAINANGGTYIFLAIA